MPTSVIRKMHESKAEAKAATQGRPGEGVGKGDAPSLQEPTTDNQGKMPESITAANCKNRNNCGTLIFALRSTSANFRTRKKYKHDFFCLF